MKKLVLSIVVLSLTTSSFAQNRLNVRQQKTITIPSGETKFSERTSKMNTVLPVRKGQTPHNMTVAVTDIGNSPNHLTVAFSAKTALFAQPEINTVSMVFRNDPSVANAAGSSGYYNFALSTDGGNTWPVTNAYPLYEATGGAAPPFANGRYPQGLIYNPTGNTNPINAYLAFTGAGLAGSNGSWGGIPHGALSLAPASSPYQAEILSDRTQVPNTLMIAPFTNKTYLLDIAVDAVVSADYVDSIALYIGTWNTSINAYDYAYSPVYAPVDTDYVGAKYVYEAKIAFAPNSNIGYISLLGHPSFAVYADSVIVPMIYKTTDGGATWTSLGAVDLANISSALPGAVDYSAWTEHDLVVDYNGNAHLIVAIGKGNNDNTVATDHGNWGLFDIYCTNGGLVSSDWHAQLLEKPQTFRYTWSSAGSAAPEDSRPQASTTWAGDKVFFTWFDTDTATFLTNENAFPDCWAKALNLLTGQWTSSMNLTTGTAADGACSFGSVSPYVFGAAGLYTIPLAYQYLADPTIGLATTTHRYVSGVEMTDAQFTIAATPIQLALITTIGINDNNSGIKSLAVYPNPASGSNNTLAFTTEKTANVSVELVNTIGQVAKTVDFGILNAGDQKLNLDVEGLRAGFYIVKVKVGDYAAVHKITVK